MTGTASRIAPGVGCLARSNSSESTDTEKLLVVFGPTFPVPSGFRSALASLLVLLWLPVSAPAAQNSERWVMCGADGFPQPFQGTAAPAGQSRGVLPARLDADFAESDPVSVTLRGSALLERGDQRVMADVMTFNRETNVLTADGNVRFDQTGSTLFGEHARLNVDTDRGEATDITYFIYSGHIRGTADKARIDRIGTADLEGVTYTTCAVDSKAWELRAKEINLDQRTGEGEAWNATLRIADIPVFYSPYLSFPIDDRRKSGFLTPRLGSSDVNGFDLTMPWYWNIAPDRDFTLLPRYMDKRGLMLGGEYRYLGRSYSGSLYGTFLNDDKLTDTDRWGVSFRHFQNPLPRWTADIDYNKVSDKRFLEDFGNSLVFSSVAQLNQRGDITYRGEGWRARGRIVKFQNVDPAITKIQEPYERVPDFSLDGRWPEQALGLTYRFGGDMTWFEHDVKTDGSRVDLTPAVNYPFLRPWGFVNPKLGLNYTAYSLRDNARGSNSITRTTPVVSVDSGLFFERPLKWQGGGLTQTLEPRLFYLYVPHRDDQGEIPRFDTNNVSQNYDFLFRESRFTGPDRIGDANQLTTALTSRILRSGRELASINVGQIQYFRDREVTISGVPDTRSRSDLIGEASINFWPQWSLRAGINWDTFENRTEKGRVDLRYNPRRGKVINLAYRFDRKDLEQTELSGTWPINRQWRVLGHWQQSIRTNRLLELLVGVEYRDCCWAIRFAGRKYRNGTADPDTKVAAYFEVELIGLAGVGTNLVRMFSERIPGYLGEE